MQETIALNDLEVMWSQIATTSGLLKGTAYLLALEQCLWDLHNCEMKKKKTTQHKTIHASKIKWIRVDRINLEGFEPYKSSLDLSNGIKIRKFLIEFFELSDHEPFMDLF